MAVVIPSVCSTCGWPMEEDLQVAIDAAFKPKLLIRQWRCKQGHSITINYTGPTPTPSVSVACDICGESFRAFRPNTRRHKECRPEFHRRRSRQYQRDLTAAMKAGCNAPR